jgi:hypothetical protein
MYAITRFGLEKREDKSGFIPGAYGGDATLFELGCFILFYIDLMLFLNYPQHRELLSGAFTRQFIRVFGEALPTVDISQLMEERHEVFSRIYQEFGDRFFKEGVFPKHPSPKTVGHHLGEMVIRTKDNVLPGEYEFTEEPLRLDISEVDPVEFKLRHWVIHILPDITKEIRQFCANAPSDKPS